MATVTRELFDRYSEQYNLYLTYNHTKFPACKKGEFHKLKNADWAEKFNDHHHNGSSGGSNHGYGMGMRLGKAAVPGWGKWLVCLEADTPEGCAELEAFLTRHSADGLVWHTREKHVLFEVDNRFEHVGKGYKGFEILQQTVMIPPSCTDTAVGGRVWRDGDEERFARGDIPKLPESAVEELLQGMPRRMARESLGQLPLNDCDFSWLESLGFEKLSEHDWKRPGSHTGARSLSVNQPAEGLVTLWSSGVATPSGRLLEPRTYNALHFASLMLDLPLKAACNRLGVEEVKRWVFARVDFIMDTDVSFVLSNLKGINERAMALRTNPRFDIAIYHNDQICGPIYEKCSTATSHRKALRKILQETLQFDEDDCEAALNDIWDVVKEKAAEQLDDYIDRSDKEGTTEFKTFTRELQAIVVKELLDSRKTFVWRELILRRDGEGYWYAPTHYNEMRKAARKHIKKYLPEAQNKDVNEIEASIMTECRLTGDERITLPANVKTWEPLPFAVAFKDCLWDAQKGQAIDTEDTLVIDVIPYTREEILTADTTIIDDALKLWFGDRAVLQDRATAYLMVAGLCLVSFRPQKFLYFQGLAGTAKSESATALSLLPGGNLVVRKPGWQALEGPHALDRFQNARLAILQDVGRSCKPEALNALKNITGETFLEVNAKYVRQTEFVKQCLVIATSNYEPPEEAAIQSRIYRIPFVHVIRNTEQQVHDWAMSELKPKGMAGFYRRALEGLQKFIANGFMFPDALEKEAEQEKVLALTAMLHSKCKMDYDGSVELSQLLEHESLVNTKQKDAVKLLRAIGIPVTQSDKGYKVLGWTLKKKPDEEF